MGGNKRFQGRDHNGKGNKGLSPKRGRNKFAPEGFYDTLKKVQTELERTDRRRKDITSETKIPTPQLKKIYNNRPRKTTTRLPYKVGRKYTEPFKSTQDIRTQTSYTINKHDNPGVLITPETNEFQKIYSCLMTNWMGNTLYRIKQFSESKEAYSDIARNSNFKDLYKTPWIKLDRQAQNELHSIEQTIRNKQKNIESHLKTDINLDQSPGGKF